MKNFKIEKQHLIALGVVVIVAIIIFVWGRYTGKKSPSKKNVQVQVNVQDNRDGTTTRYNPTPMVDKLHEVLSAWAWNGSAAARKRCSALSELVALSNTAPVDFMAVVYGYKKKHGITLLEAIRACWLQCFIQEKGPAVLVLKERVEALSNIIKINQQ